ncbi:hypothetical protein JCM10049v2_002126 [Rhodotorula toruloides]
MSGSSSAASPATAPAFPKVGDTFPSLLAFKLACHRAALASGIELKIKTGDANRADMRCRLGERATVNKVMDGPCCSFQIAVYKSFVEANGGDFRVNKRNLVHSCPLEVRQQHRSSGDTAQWSRGKIKEFEYALRKEEAPPATSPPEPAPDFLADLEALISLLMPDLPPTLTSRLASSLNATGIRSISDLSDALLFETDRVLPKFLEGLAYREGADIAQDALLFLQLLRVYSMDGP